jgi:hypothetical protein
MTRGDEDALDTLQRREATRIGLWMWSMVTAHMCVYTVF